MRWWTIGIAATALNLLAVSQGVAATRAPRPAPNTQHSTPNAQRLNARTPERLKASAPNAQRPTPNARNPNARTPERLNALVPYPASVQLRDREQTQQLILSAASPSGPRDATSTAVYRSSKPHVVSVSAVGLLTPVADGKAVVTAAFGGVRAAIPVAVSGTKREEPVSFVHDVEPVLSRSGCNQGGCHGKASGQNGFKLSLFGFDPAFDYDAIAREGRGRRVSQATPDDSLVLQKATMSVPHGGGRRFERNSPPYRLLRRWIAQGMAFSAEGRSALVSLSVTPDERLMGRSSSQQLAVTAHFADGTTRDVTPGALFRSNEETIASVDEAGRVRTGKEFGEAAVMASYMGQVAVFRAAVPPGAPASAFGAFPPNNYVDDLVLKKLRKLGIPPSGLCSDAEFLRRASLDLCGRLPKPDEVRAFLAECAAERRSYGSAEVRKDGSAGATPAPSHLHASTPGSAGATPILPHSHTPTPGSARATPSLAHSHTSAPTSTLPHFHTSTPEPPEHGAFHAREHLVDRLLDDPDYASFFAMKWAGILRNTGQYRAAAYAFHAWIREAIATNMPYDRFVRAIVAGQGEWEEHPPVSWYWQFRDGGVPEMVGDVSQLFLGLRIQCAKCHHHPYEKWSQDDYYGLAGFFTRMGRKIIHEPGYYYAARRVTDGLTNPTTGKPAVPKLLDGPEITVRPGDDPRLKLADWMAEPTNPFFAPEISNRMWAHFMGRGLVDPIDDMRVTNPPSNPELLAALSQDLVAHKFDLKHLIRTIVTSRTYQLSSVPNKYNASDRQHYARYYGKRLLAEVLSDAIDQTTGVKTNFSGVSSQARAIDLPHEEFPSYFLDVFGRPKQLSSPCECARDPGANLSQVLNLVNSPELDGKITSGSGRAALLAKSEKPLPEKIEELYLWAFSRPPDADESKKAMDYVSGEKEQQRAFQELLWTFINCREFQFNH